MEQKLEIPVYLFTGFLGSGKTMFIQDALEGRDFNDGERTLLLMCEDGEEEYQPDRFYGKNVFIEEVEEESDLTPAFLAGLVEKHNAERVIVEYNGMWMLDTLFMNMPPEWLVYQEMTFADASTFVMYNQNMRQQTFDKLKSAELVIFNRCVRDEGFRDRQLEIHKICRVANRRSQILYEFAPDDVILDDIADPLPYDMDAPLIEIEDDMFAEWYRDINENPDTYDGKELIVRGRAVTGGGLDRNCFVFGRHVMTCCVEDIQFAGLLCVRPEDSEEPENGGWIRIRAEVRVEYTPVYQEEGPVLYCASVEKAEPAEPEVAMF